MTKVLTPVKVLELTFRRDSPFNELFRKLIHLWEGLPDFWEGRVENLGYKGEISQPDKLNSFPAIAFELVRSMPRARGL